MMPHDLQLLVPSRSRAARCKLLSELPHEALQCTALVVPEAQAADYTPLAAQYDVELWPCPVDGIALVREWAVHRSQKPKVLMLDDDIAFLQRKDRDHWQLRACRHGDVLPLMAMISDYLEQWAHVSISAREGQHVHPYPHYEVGRPLRALAYRRAEFLQCKHGRVQVMEDFDVTLQLLRRGLANCIITAYAQGQGRTQAKGGCSDYRTDVLQEESARTLAQLHFPYVQLRRIEGRCGAFGSRWDVAIAWQAAYRRECDDQATIFDYA